MKRVIPLLSSRFPALLLLAAGLGGSAWAADAPAGSHLTIPVPGGMPGLPLMTGIHAVSNGVTVTWFGPSGYYQLYQKQDLLTPTWQAVGGLRFSNQALVGKSQPRAFFKVSGPSPQYAGSRACLECHAGVHATVAVTPHAAAYTNRLFEAHGGQTNRSCLACHTVGYGLPTGFTFTNRNGRLSYLTNLAGVQCENCHGPAGRHAANPDDVTVRPRADVAAAVCGGCHDATAVPSHVAALHPPYYSEWNASAHRAVRDELKTSFLTGGGPSGSIAQCGGCHSGTVRDALLNGAPLPGGHEAGAVGIACATCHDSHRTHVHTNALAGVQSFTNALTGFRFVFTNQALGPRYTNQLREAMASLVDYRTTGAFVTNYDARVNGCAQCHNDRGATFMDTATPPHRSAQYNMLLGTVGVVPGAASPNFPGAHSRIEQQCVACHMPVENQQSGHHFTVTSYESCASCHGTAANAEGFTFLLRGIVTSLSQNVKDGLDAWAIQKAPDVLRQYGRLAWEYEQAGHLSSPDGTLNGPTRTEQAFIPANIRKARFNLYLVINDGSGGVHNGPYAITLLQAARDWVQLELGN